MRHAPILEIAIREVARFCEFADFAYTSIDKSGGREALHSYFHIHALLCHCAMVARLLWSPELAKHAEGRTIAELLDVPRPTRIEDKTVREIVERYDLRLAQGLALRGEVGKVLDFNIGDRDAFEEELSLFLRHYDPTVETLTLMEEEFNLAHIAADLADVGARARAWLDANAVLAEQAGAASIPPRH